MNFLSDNMICMLAGYYAIQDAGLKGVMNCYLAVDGEPVIRHFNKKSLRITSGAVFRIRWNLKPLR